MSRDVWRNVIWGVVLLVVLAAIAGVFAVWYASKAPETDKLTDCRLDGRHPAHVVILIDQSDPFRKTDLDWVKKVLDEETRTVRDFGKVTVLGLSSIEYEPTELFSRCSPGSPEAVNETIKNKRFIDIEWRRRLFNPLMAATDEALKRTREEKSPIVEALVEIMGRSDFTAAVAQRRIVVISDLMQNSQNFSHYSEGVSVSAFERTPVSKTLRNLEGIEVSVHVIPRRQYSVNPERLATFWQSIIESRGGTFSRK